MHHNLLHMIPSCLLSKVAFLAHWFRVSPPVKVRVVFAIGGFVLLSPMYGGNLLCAQYIGFGLSFGEGITLLNEGSGISNDGELNFNRVLSPPVLVRGSEKVTISLTDNADGVVIIAIDAPARSDVAITVTAPAGNVLTLDEGNGGEGTPSTLPFQIGWAFWNLGVAGSGLSDVLPQSDFGHAREIVSATGTNIPFMSATFPMIRSANRSAGGGPPLPPPDPKYAGRPQLTQAEMARAFLLVYGSLGPMPENAQVGQYTGTIDVYAELVTYGDDEL